MTRLRFFPLAACCILLALSACISSGKRPLRLYQRNSGDLINMNVGDTLEVVLDGDPTTEVHWLPPPGDPGILQQLGRAEYRTDLETHTAPQRLRLRFKAAMEGRTRLQLVYPSPTNRLVDREFEVWVVVKAPG